MKKNFIFMLLGLLSPFTCQAGILDVVTLSDAVVDYVTRDSVSVDMLDQIKNEKFENIPLTQISDSVFEHEYEDGSKSVFLKSDNGFFKETYYENGKKTGEYTLKYGYRDGPAKLFNDNGDIYAEVEYKLEPIRHNKVGFAEKIICLDYDQDHHVISRTEIPFKKLSHVWNAKKIDCSVLTAEFSVQINGQSFPLKKISDHIYLYEYPDNSWKIEFIEEDGKLVKKISYLKGIKMWEYVLTDEKTTGPAIAYYPDGSNEILAEVLFENGEMISGKCPDYNSDG
ncbi:MAG: hypothetical protein IJV07_01695 [Alphaproteobacteria bacterium]|nr:hypothetical protein [Alphaproteobacteria bacterium]